MGRLTKSQFEERGRFIAQAAAKVGIRKVESWLRDPVKLRIINALVAATSGRS